MMKKSGAQMDSNWPTANAMGGSCNLRMLLQSLTPAVRGDYAKHNCPLDQYVRLAADAMMVELRIVSNVLLDASILADDGLFEKLNNYQDATDP